MRREEDGTQTRGRVRLGRGGAQPDTGERKWSWGFVSTSAPKGFISSWEIRSRDDKFSAVPTVEQRDHVLSL